MRENNKEENVNHDRSELETIYEDLENSVAKLISENERLCNEINHVKKVFKDQFDSIKKIREQDDILRGIVKQTKAKQPLDNALDFTCKHAKRIQELLVYVRDTCPNAIKLSEKKVAVTPINKVKKVRFSEPLTSSSKIKQVESSKTSDFNTPVLSSIGLKCSTSTCRSQSTGNKKNDRISQPPSRNMKNKVEAQPRKVRYTNHVVEPVFDADVKHSLLNANSELICATCNQCMFDAIYDKCLLDFVKNLIAVLNLLRNIKNVWNPTGHVFTEVGFKWKPTGRTFTLVGSSCPLTRITPTKIILWYLDSGCSKHMTGNRSQLINFVSKFLGTVRFGNDQIAKIIGYGDYQLGKLSKDDLARGIPKLKFQKDHLCLACALGKSKKSSHQPKPEDNNQEILYLLHMDLCGLLVESINGKKYILEIVDDYSRFTWVTFLRTKDKASEAIIKCIKNIQVYLNETVRKVRTDNGTEFVNQTLREFYENVSISHETSVARTPQQNDVIERQNRTLVEATRTMLIFSKAIVLLWAKALNTTCYTQNRSLIRLRYNKTPYELMHDKKPNLSFLHIFGSVAVVVRDFYKKFYNSLGSVPNRCSVV
ncbi:retrovirus-related pol polyprotein from transposon TNT 1-94 [Tanacetum coccineum]|uniref:Retrovirus-related pol polyprotein from transposon TNT 1-94 n=1 Tax=Tanacetum coccineum TaxID=301880 RepID=A0ABQ5IC09_9ASTR